LRLEEILFGAGKKKEFEAGGNATPEREDRSPQRWRSGDGPGWGRIET